MPSLGEGMLVGCDDMGRVDPMEGYNKYVFPWQQSIFVAAEHQGIGLGFGDDAYRTG
jgi:hypothetical protein